MTAIMISPKHPNQKVSSQTFLSTKSGKQFFLKLKTTFCSQRDLLNSLVKSLTPIFYNRASLVDEHSFTHKKRSTSIKKKKRCFMIIEQICVFMQNPNVCMPEFDP